MVGGWRLASAAPGLRCRRSPVLGRDLWQRAAAVAWAGVLEGSRAACSARRLHTRAHARCSPQAKEAESARHARERDAVRSDMDVLLQQRGQMDGLKSMLMHTLGARGVGPSTSAPRHALPSVRPATMISGEGQY